ncbi:MAG: SusD/RagB family nutrient-binding outer membrane lipoprotein [Gemmatimonadota bacterium]
MHKWTKSALAATALTLTLSGCDDFLTGTGVSDNPNAPVEVGTAQLYQAIQLTQIVQHTGDLARHTAMWTQQMAGIGNQYSGRDQYVVTEQDLAAWYNAIYTGGGLIDIREVITRSEASNDRTYAGIARVWEAYLMGESASLWGALPYSEAVKEDVTTPKLDAQADVYAEVQATLDKAIADLQSGQGTGPGPTDLIYGGDRAKWRQLAYTLKARFYMHWVEAQAFSGTHNGKNVSAEANKACGGNCLQKAVAAAANGISTPANNFTSYQSTTAGGENLWYQFMFVRRQGQIAAGRNLVELMKSRNDPRLEQYFAPASTGQVVGAAPAGASGSLLSATRGAPGFRQPMVTYAENQLILAEAHYLLGTGNPLTHLNNARTAEGLTAVSGLSGAALLREIMLEKYIAQFQNVDAYNDYKRTCIPEIKPAGTAQSVIGRILYSDTERAANPNIPLPTAQPSRNDNDPQACPRPA